ncbi:MAG: gamma-glutamylcyclotransferase family protein [Pirellulales bacterium]
MFDDSLIAGFFMDRWYFAYGSNLLTAQMVARTNLDLIHASPQRAVLFGYRVAFNIRGSDERLYANIVPDAESVTYGVVYRCPPQVLAKLDVFETGYHHLEVEVTTIGGESLSAIAYLARPERVAPEGRPSDEYLARILTGGREQGLPVDYLAGIERLATITHT